MACVLLKRLENKTLLWGRTGDHRCPLGVPLWTGSSSSPQGALHLIGETSCPLSGHPQMASAVAVPGCDLQLSVTSGDGGWCARGNG